MKRKNLILLGVAVFIFLIIGVLAWFVWDPGPYENIGGVYYKTKKFVYTQQPANYEQPTFFRIFLADYKTFKVCDFYSDYATDKNRVYKHGELLSGIDSKTFVPMGDYYKDKNGVYLKGKKLPSVDAATFQFLEIPFSKDKNHVYYDEQIVQGADPNTFEIVQGRYFSSYNTDIDSVSAGNYLYAKDKSHVYLGSLIIKDADASTWNLYDDFSFYSHDKNNIYYRENKLINNEPVRIILGGRTKAYLIDQKNDLYRGDKLVGHIDGQDFTDNAIFFPNIYIYDNGRSIYIYDTKSSIYYDNGMSLVKIANLDKESFKYDSAWSPVPESDLNFYQMTEPLPKDQDIKIFINGTLLGEDKTNRYVLSWEGVVVEKK